MSSFERVEDIFQGIVVTQRLVHERMGGTRPSFNVCEPFPAPNDYDLCEPYPNKRGVTVVQMNKPMANTLIEFIDPTDTELDPRLRDFCDALSVPQDDGNKSSISFEPQFKVCAEFNGVIIVLLNSPMVDLVTKFIKSIEEQEEDGIDTIFYAFRSALINPARSREIRQSKREDRVDNRSNGRRFERRDEEFDDDLRGAEDTRYRRSRR